MIMTYIIMDVIIGVGDVVESSTVGRSVCACFFFWSFFFLLSVFVYENRFGLCTRVFFLLLSCRCSHRTLLSTLITGVTRFIDVCAINTDTMANITEKRKKKISKKSWMETNERRKQKRRKKQFACKENTDTGIRRYYAKMRNWYNFE